MKSSSAAANYWQGLTHIGPHAGAHRVAVRAGVSVAIPLVALWALDRVDWSLYAVFGAFAAVYGRNVGHALRLRAQSAAAASLVAAVVLGTLVAISPARQWWAIPVATMIAAVVAIIARRGAWHPPGVLFQVFAFGACSSVPSEIGDVPVAFGLSAASALLAVLIGAAGRLRGTNPSAAPSPVVTPSREVALEALQYAIAVLAAGVLATGLGIGHPYWAMVAAVVPLAAGSTTGRLVRATHRLIGTALGLAVAALLLALDPGPLMTVLIAIALQMAAELLIGRNYSLALLFVTPLALLMVHLSVETPASALVLDRAVETLLGIVVGVVVSVVARQRPRAGLN